MTLERKEAEALSRLAERASKLSGIYFRSVDYRYMNPSVVLNGRGAEMNGGRFAPVGIKATYLSDSDRTASAEVTEQKRRLGGKSLITLDKYPRVVFGVKVSVSKHVDLTRHFRSRTLETLVQACLDPNSLETSQAVGAFLVGCNIQAILFPSLAAPHGHNLVIYVDDCPLASLSLVNVSEFTKALRKITTTTRRL